MRNHSELQRRINHTVYFGTESIPLLAPSIWELIPSDIRNADSLGIFKGIIKFRTTGEWLHKLCKTYIGNVGFFRQCSTEARHTTCGVTLSSFSSVSFTF